MAVNIYDQLRRDEGDAAKMYFLNGIPHIGVGHNLKDGPALSFHARDMILHDDLALVFGDCQHLDGWNKLNDARQGVLINLAFRLGFSGLEGFTHMLQAVALGDWHGAAWELRNSNLAKEPPVERTERLATQMETGLWV